MWEGHQGSTTCQAARTIRAHYARTGPGRSSTSSPSSCATRRKRGRSAHPSNVYCPLRGSCRDQGTRSCVWHAVRWWARVSGWSLNSSSCRHAATFCAQTRIRRAHLNGVEPHRTHAAQAVTPVLGHYPVVVNAPRKQPDWLAILDKPVVGDPKRAVYSRRGVCATRQH